MSDSTPARTPSSVERMASTSKSSGGMSSLITILLVVACICLMAGCFYFSSAKRQIQTDLDTMTTKYNDAQKSLDASQGQIANLQRDNQTLRVTNNTSIPLSRLPAAVQAPTVAEALTKIVALSEAPKTESPIANNGKTSTTPVPADPSSPAAWMETIAKQVAKGSINTKEATNNDAAKVQMHKGIQIVLAKIGAFNKPPTGLSTDTYDAVVAFQKANKLTADGIIGKGTWGKVRERMEATAHVPQ